MITHGEITVPITTLFDVYFLQALHESGIHALLCATSVCSVPLWFIIAQKKQPQRHRAHRGCTEKKPNRDFSCKALRRLSSVGRRKAIGARRRRQAFRGHARRVSFSPDYSSAKIFVRFAVVQKKRMMDWHK